TNKKFRRKGRRVLSSVKDKKITAKERAPITTMLSGAKITNIPDWSQLLLIRLITILVTYRLTVAGGVEPPASTLPENFLGQCTQSVQSPPEQKLYARLRIRFIAVHSSFNGCPNHRLFAVDGLPCAQRMVY